jgi:DNA-binding NarL/FixJ family response regulator
MPKDIRVLVVCQDPFARSWMTSLLVRDWRTRVIGELEDKPEMLAFFKYTNERVDMILLDVDGMVDVNTLGQVPQLLSGLHYPPAVLCVGSQPDGRVLHQMQHHSFLGYIIKSEIRDSLGWAVSLAAVGHWVMTPGVEPLLADAGFELPGKRLVLNGRAQFYDFTESEARVARLAFIYSVERRDLADELKISKAWCYGVVSSIYDKLGMEAILASQVNPTEYLGDNPIVLAHLKEIIQRLGGSKKAQDLETLAFHLLSMPEIR